MLHDAGWARRAQRELRVLLNDWDPIGAAVPDDEYDCIRDPLISHMLRGADDTQIAEFLKHAVADHFGLDPSVVSEDVVGRIVAWWTAIM